MQQAPNHLLSWLDHLRILMPPRHVTLVGAGNGSGPWVQWLLSRAVPSATLVEADDALIHPLQATVAAASGAWRVRKQVIGPETATVTFHVASVSSESGLLEPESLRSLWPNLKTRQKQTRQAITLDELLQDDEQSANWLIVDCWPAQPLLQGGQQALSQMDVLIVRTTMGADTPDTLNPAEVESALTEAGFRQIAADAGRHPGVGHALYVRELDAKTASAAEVEQWRNEATRLQESMALAQTHNERLTAQAAALVQEKARAEEELQKTQQALSAQLAAAQEAKARAEHQTQALEQQAQSMVQAAAREQQLTQALQQASALAQERERHASTAQAHSEQLAAQKAALEHRLQQADLALQQAVHRERALEIAVNRAEAQLEAIKALWARESSA